MKKVYFLLFGLLIAFSAHAQDAPVVGYFDEYWKPVSKENATFYRTAEPQGKLFLVRDYYMSGQPQMDPVLCTAYEPKLQFEASVKLYYPSGKVREQGIIKNEDRVGFHRYWYESGQLQKEVIYTPGAKEKYIQFYSAEGKPLLTKSTGEFQEIDNSNTTVEVRDSVVVAVYVREGSDVIYLVVDQPAEYKGGLPAMYRQLSSSLRVPKEIRQSRSIARVYVKFVVDESGKSSRHEIIKGFSPACDAEALKGTKTLNKWKPARHKGKVVKSSFVLPVVFRSE